mmetsp:Transcript_14672/g.34950  ORF Transcript_14672/g.34950 Transcript_14672/m.34950 type:complete len:174 (-) Transcript_14672:1385-1906(-)
MRGGALRLSKAGADERRRTTTGLVPTGPPRSLLVEEAERALEERSSSLHSACASLPKKGSIGFASARRSAWRGGTGGASRDALFASGGVAERLLATRGSPRGDPARGDPARGDPFLEGCPGELHTLRAELGSERLVGADRAEAVAPRSLCCDREEACRSLPPGEAARLLERCE